MQLLDKRSHSASDHDVSMAAKRSTVIARRGGRSGEVVAGDLGTLSGGATGLVVLACTRRHTVQGVVHMRECLYDF